MLPNKNKKPDGATTTTPHQDKVLSHKKSKKSPPNNKQILSHKKASKTKEERSQLWTFLVYPDDVNKSDWREYLKKQHVSYMISPLHDKDKFDKDDDRGHKKGDLKKAHYHVLLEFSGKKSFSKVKGEITKPLGSPIPEVIHDKGMMVRYCFHRDDPEKAQYKIVDAEVYGTAFDIEKYMNKGSSSNYKLLREIFRYCKDYHITEYATIVDYCLDERPDWLPLVVKTFRASVADYVKSQRYSYSSSSMQIL